MRQWERQRFASGEHCPVKKVHVSGSVLISEQQCPNQGCDNPDHEGDVKTKKEMEVDNRYGHPNVHSLPDPEIESGFS
jgi:hypothetical protein